MVERISPSEKKTYTEVPSPLQEHHVYLEWYLDSRAGGPPGYLANLLLGCNRISHYTDPAIVFNSYKGKAPKQKKYPPKKPVALVKWLIGLFPGGSTFYNRHISRSLKTAFQTMCDFLSDLDAVMPDAELIGQIDWNKTKTIHVHTAAEVVKVKNYLRKNFLDDVKVILTCHTPESVAKEQYALAVADGQPPERAKIMSDLWLKLEIRGYTEADIMIFPSKEAMEPLLHDIDGFAQIIQGKDIRFMPTGAIALTPTISKEAAKEKFGVSGKVVVGYIGRHNHIKGYDLLKEAAEQVLKNTKDVVFLIGGSQGSAFAPLEDSRWIEAGWVNPAEMLQAVDVFVLPNRQTYYDLVLLEVLSMGIPVVATATGGNKSVKEIADDLELCDVSSESMAEAIQKLVHMRPDQREEKGLHLQRIYEDYFTETHMAQRYVDTIRKIYDDYDLWDVIEEDTL